MHNGSRPHTFFKIVAVNSAYKNLPFYHYSFIKKTFFIKLTRPIVRGTPCRSFEEKYSKKKLVGENNGQLRFVRHHVWRTQARLDQFL